MDVRTLEMVIADAVRNEMTGFEVLVNFNGSPFKIEKLEFKESHIEIKVDVPKIVEINYDESQDYIDTSVEE